MEARMKNPALLIPETMQSLLALNAEIQRAFDYTWFSSLASQPDQRVQRLR